MIENGLKIILKKTEKNSNLVKNKNGPYRESQKSLPPIKGEKFENDYPPHSRVFVVSEDEVHRGSSFS